MQIIYKDDTQSILGSIEYKDITTALLPDLRNKTHKVFSQHQFAGQNNLHWEVLDISQASTQITVDLKAVPRNHSNFGYYSTDVRKQKSSTHYLKQWNIVGVDFSHHSECHQLGQTPLPNYDYPTARLPGELHKLRPCIVLKTSGDTTQVIPLSTKEYNAKVTSSIALSKLSFDKLPQSMRADTSYALLHMVSTVSSYRIYPLDGAHGTPLDHNKQQKLCTSDIHSIEEGLGKHFSAKIKQQIATKDQQLSSKLREIQGLKGRQAKDNDRYNEQKKQLEEREDLIRQLGRECDIDDEDINKVMEEIKKSLLQSDDD